MRGLLFNIKAVLLQRRASETQKLVIERVDEGKITNKEFCKTKN